MSVVHSQGRIQDECKYPSNSRVAPPRLRQGPQTMLRLARQRDKSVLGPRAAAETFLGQFLTDPYRSRFRNLSWPCLGMQPDIREQLVANSSHLRIRCRAIRLSVAEAAARAVERCVDQFDERLAYCTRAPQLSLSSSSSETPRLSPTR